MYDKLVNIVSILIRSFLRFWFGLSTELNLCVIN